MSLKRVLALPLFFLLLLLGGIGAYLSYENWLEHSQDIPILNAARRYGVNPALLKAVVWRESRFHPAAHGSRGEIGLMQIIPGAAGADWQAAEKITNMPPSCLEDPSTNTLVGAWYLKKLLRRYSNTDDPLPYALADYNAGRGNVLKWNQGEAATNSVEFIRAMKFPGTRLYVATVIERYKYYGPKFPSNN